MLITACKINGYRAFNRIPLCISFFKNLLYFFTLDGVSIAQDLSHKCHTPESSSPEAGTVRAKGRSLPLTKVLRALKIWGDHTGLG